AVGIGVAAVSERGSLAVSFRADVVRRAGDAVVARAAVRENRIALARFGITGRARIVAHDRIAARAGSALATVGLRAGVVVVACRAVALGGVRALACSRVAGARVVALIAGRTHHRIGARANAAVAGVGLRTRVAVVA